MKVKTVTIAAAAALCVLCSTALFSGAAGGAGVEKLIGSLDEVFFDGRKLVFAYTVESKCAESKHDAKVDLYVEKTAKKVKALYIDIIDVSPEAACSGKPAAVTVASEKNIGGLIRDELDSLEEAGYVIPPDLVVELPPVRPRPSGVSSIGGTSGTVVLPTRNDEDEKKPAPVAPAAPPQPTMVDVIEVSYAPAWRCNLRKNDGSRRDGFDGYGTTVQEARNNAASGCMSTNHPKCFDFSNDPAHTQCGFELKESQKVVQYRSDQLPAGAKTASWACELWKNDGSRKDGFTGAAATEDEARGQAASGCLRTNHPLCEAFSQDDAHTKCAQTLRLEKAKPQTQWTCTLWKKDGSRKDGFRGSGATEAEARSNTLPGCYVTNHPKCGEWSRDPAHTACDVKLIYPEEK